MLEYRVALETDLTRAQRENLMIVANLANSLLLIIDDILDISKIEAGRMRMEEIAFSVRSTVFGVLKTLAVRATQNKLDLLYQTDPAISDYMIGDPFRLRQIITNLVGNAIKFTQSGAVSLSCRLVSHDDVTDTSVIEFCVGDTGIGIKSDKLSLIFDTFCQADGSTTRKYGGTGLGLTISKRLVSLMGGELWVTSEYGRGSKFYFTIRAKRAVWAAEQVQAKLAQAHPGRKVLFVDTVGNSSGAQRAIIETGLVLIVVPSLEAACAEQIAGGAFDAVVVDQLSLVEELRDIEHLRYIPLVLVASDIPQLNLKYCLDYGIANFIEPPSNAQDMSNALLPALDTSNRNATDLIGEVSLRVLLAEDSELPRLSGSLLTGRADIVNQRVASKFLESAGHKVDIVENGALAVEAYQRKVYDVLVLSLAPDTL
jgi:osomolarity two-component system sensor histidine kinase NIK1